MIIVTIIKVLTNGLSTYKVTVNNTVVCIHMSEQGARDYISRLRNSIGRLYDCSKVI